MISSLLPLLRSNVIFQLTDLVFMGNPLEEELSEAEEYNNKVVRSVSQTFLPDKMCPTPKKINKLDSHKRVLAELQKLDGLPVIRGDQEEEEASAIISFS